MSAASISRLSLQVRNLQLIKLSNLISSQFQQLAQGLMYEASRRTILFDLAPELLCSSPPNISQPSLSSEPLLPVAQSKEASEDFSRCNETLVM